MILVAQVIIRMGLAFVISTTAALELNRNLLRLGYDGNGRRKRRTVYGATKDEVAKKLRKLQTAADTGRLPDAGSLTVGLFLDTWLHTLQGKVANNTLLPYETQTARFIKPHLGRVKLSAMNSLHVQAFYADLATGGASASMIRRVGTTLGVALQHAVELELIPHNPARSAKKPKHTAKEMTALDRTQVLLFLDAARQDRLYALYVFLIDSGARPGEAFGLQWQDIDWSASAVSLVRSLEEVKGVLALKELKTKKSRRRIALTGFLMEALGEHRQAMLREGNYRTDGPVFCASDGSWLRQSNVLRRSFRPILFRANAKIIEDAATTQAVPVLLPPIRPYDLRHSSATLLLLAGEDTKVVAERLGHSTTRLTLDTYQHVLPGMQERAAAKMEGMLRPQQGTERKAGG